MANYRPISRESDQASPLPTTAVTRRSLLGGAGIAVGAAVLASPPSMPGIAPAAAQPVSAEPATARRGVQAPRLRSPRGLREHQRENSHRAPPVEWR
jgi:hypothetical protein